MDIHFQSSSNLVAKPKAKKKTKLLKNKKQGSLSRNKRKNMTTKDVDSSEMPQA